MIEIRLYCLKDTVRRNMLNKNLDSITYIQLNGEFRDAVDVSNPTIVIDISESANITAVGGSNPESELTIFKLLPIRYINYVYIPYLKRYYFVKKITLLRNNIFAIDLHVDVLETYRYFISKQKAFISRNQTNFNRLLPDERRIVLNKKEQTIFKPARTENNLVNTTFNTDLGASDWHIVVNFVRDIPKDVFESFITSKKYISQLPNIPNVRKTFSFNACLWSLVTTPSGLVDVISTTAINDNIASYCAGVYVYPFVIETGQYEDYEYLTIAYGNVGAGGNNIKDKDGNSTHANPTSTFTSLSKELIIEDFTITDDWFTDFNDLEPYSQYEIYIPYYGWKVINIASLRGHRLLIYYIVNYASNNATVYLYDYTDELIIWSADCTLGVEVSISSSNAKEVQDKTTANRLNLTLNMVGSMLSMGMGAVKGNTLAMAGGLLSGVKALGQAYTSELMNYERGQVQFSSNGTALLSPQEVYIRKIKSLIQYDLTNDFLSEQGGVCNELYLINDIRNSGYTEIADIPNITMYGQPINGIPTDNEVDEILSTLKNGVILNL